MPLPSLKSKPKAVFNLDLFRDEIMRAIDRASRPVYEPTGLQEDIIIPFGSGKYQIVLAICANKVGKSCTAINILKNIFWENDPKWFNYPLFNSWPFPKRGRITATTKNAAEDGPIYTEILRWWPKGRYTATKAGKHYYSQISTDTGFSGDILTYEQGKDQLEGPLCGWTLSDEPVPASWVGGIMSRFSLGGVWIIAATPIECGVFLDTLGDLKEKGMRIHTVSANIFENSITKGKPNHLKTKRGLMTEEQIKDYVAGIPLDERDARIYGKPSNKSGKIYPMFNLAVHVKDFDLTGSYAKRWNCYCAMDPHRKYYPAIQWWAVTPDEKYIVYNEWPTKEHLGAYYDEVRDSRICNFTPDQIAEFIQIQDYAQIGLQMMGRCMDPRFALGNAGEFGNSTDSLQQVYLTHGLKFDIPPVEEISVQRDHIRTLLQYNEKAPVNQYNEPSIYIMPHCLNTIRAFDRIHWEEGKEKEAEDFKDFIDCARYFFAYLGNRRYVDPVTRPKKEEIRDLLGEMVEGVMGR
ncbi:hypothetical protein CCP3SC15_300006 [Gammaproteobacteria bacterium]